MYAKALHTPGPGYSDVASRFRHQDTTVLWLVAHETGHPQVILIARIIGWGLDDDAVETVRNWRFKPAERNRQPVATEINIEVDFRLD